MGERVREGQGKDHSIRPRLHLSPGRWASLKPERVLSATRQESRPFQKVVGSEGSSSGKAQFRHDDAERGLSSRRFLFVTGKGGTGKTTVTAALALAFAAQGKRVLCAMCQAKDRLSELFEGPSIGDQIVQQREGIWAVNMHPEAALQEYGMMVLRVKALHRAVFGNHLVMSFFRATPGLHAWAMLGKAWFHTTETRSDGTPRFDVVIVDAPSTGHALDMLRGPKVIVDIAPPGLLHREALKAWQMFSDPAKAGIVLVTLPEEMPATETIELQSALLGELGLPIAQVVTNGVIPPLFTPAERVLLGRSPCKECKTAAQQILALGAQRAQRERAQEAALETLQRGIHAPMTYLPHVFGGVQRLEQVEMLAKRLA